MRLLIVLSAAALTACASTQDIYESSVDESVFIDRPPAEVSQCLQMRLSSAPITTPDGRQTFLIKNQYGSTLAMMSLAPQDGGTRIEIRRAQSAVHTGQWRKCR